MLYINANLSIFFNVLTSSLNNCALYLSSISLTPSFVNGIILSGCPLKPSLRQTYSIVSLKCLTRLCAWIVSRKWQDPLLTAYMNRVSNGFAILSYEIPAVIVGVYINNWQFAHSSLTSQVSGNGFLLSYDLILYEFAISLI